MAKLRMPVERAGKVLADRIRAGEDVAAKVELAEDNRRIPRLAPSLRDMAKRLNRGTEGFL
jgi:hypothetical protein